eukprot:4348923-Pyramimonas_sp.AAC.1
MYQASGTSLVYQTRGTRLADSCTRLMYQTSGTSVVYHTNDQTSGTRPSGTSLMYQTSGTSLMYQTNVPD